MDELIASVENIRPPLKRSVVVTFDDGYDINRKYACGILMEKKVPAIFYVNTYTLGSDKYFWWDELQSILSGVPKNSGHFMIEVCSRKINLPRQTPAQKTHNFFVLHRLLKGLNHTTRDKILSELREQVNGQASDESAAERKPLTENEITMLFQHALFETGGHTHSHCALSLLTPEEQRFEIQENKKVLEEITGKPVSHFSYPFGGNSDYDDITETIVRESGYKSAVTTVRQPFRFDSDVYNIPRISVKNWTATTFKQKLEQLLVQ